MANEQDLQQLYMEFQMLNQSIKQLEQQHTLLNDQLMELMISKQSIEEFKELKEGSEILVPLTTGIYAKATVKDNRDFLVNVGANTTVKKSNEQTAKLIERQIEEVKKVMETTLEQLQQHTQKASALEHHMKHAASHLKQ